MTSLKRTVIYTRQSTNEKSQPNSKEMQKHTCLKVAVQNGWVVHEIVHDEISARTKNKNDRKGLNRLLSEVEAGTVERIIVFKRDRLARNANEYMEILGTLQKFNVDLRFAAANEPPIIPGMISDFLEYILAGMAELEGNAIHDRKIQSRRIKAKDGFWAGGSPPFGYESLEGVLSIDKSKTVEEQYFKHEIVLNLFDDFISSWSEDLTLEDIVIKMKKHRGEVGNIWKDLNVETLQKRISNRIYRGQLLQKVEGQVIRTMGIKNRSRIKELAIIDKDTWRKANKLLCQTIKKYPFVEKEEVTVPLFSGLIYCKYCNQTMVPKIKYYSCDNVNCMRKKFQVPIIELDKSILKHFIYYWETNFLKNEKDWRFLKLKAHIIGVYEDNINTQKKQLQFDETKLVESFLQKDENSTLIALKKYEGTLNELKEACEKFDFIKKVINDLFSWWKGYYSNCTPKEKEHIATNLIYGLVNKITVSPTLEFVFDDQFNLLNTKGDKIGSK